MSVCLVLLAIFCKLINEGSWGATRLRQILFQIGKNLLRRLFRCCNRLMERIVWAVRKVMSCVKVRATWFWPKKWRCVVLPQNLCCVCWCITPWIFDKAWDNCCPPAALLSRFGSCGLFLVPEVEILTKRPPISDGRRGRRKFDTGPLRCPTKHLPGRSPEMEKTLGEVYQE